MIARVNSTGQPWWRAALVVFGSVVAIAELVQVPGLFGSYAIDVFGPALVYIYVRGLHTSQGPTRISRLASPEVYVIGIVAVCFLVELAQYFRLYNKHYDPYDFVAYVSLLLPCYGLDRWLLSRKAET